MLETILPVYLRHDTRLGSSRRLQTLVLAGEPVSVMWTWNLPTLANTLPMDQTLEEVPLSRTL